MSGLRIGDITVRQVIEDERALFVPDRFLPNATPELIAAERDWMTPRYYDEPTGSLVLSVQSYVFRSQGKTILVDTCVGNHKEGRRRESWNHGSWPWLENLSAAGYQPEDVDVVLCTHLHVDHAGWNTRLENGRWVPTFPNAEYLMARPELDGLEHKREHGHAQYRHLYEDSVLPVIQSGQAITVETDHRIDPAVCLEPSPGHTTGHVSIRIDSNGERGVAIGDMIHHPIQAIHPDWNSRVCDLPEQAIETRKAFLGRCAEDGAWVLPAHFDPCRVKRDGSAFRFAFP